MKKVLSFILTVSILLSTFAGLGFHASAADLPSSGQCGENVTYTFDASTGLLTISGSGAISSSAFRSQSAIKTVVINNGVTSIGDSVFRECSGLTRITIPNTVTVIRELAFYKCYSLTSITIPNSVTSIGNQAFHYCSGLTSATIGDFVTSIGGWAFSGCSGLTSITIPNSVTSIGNNIFFGCSGLTSVTIGESVTSIESSAFGDCSGLTRIIIPDSVTSIGDYAFTGCSGLTSITIPSSVTSISNTVIQKCNGLTSITVDSANPVYDSRGDCNAIIQTSTNTLIAGCKSTTIPNSVTSIGNYAFRYLGSLESITIPNSVKSIGLCAFAFCDSITSITIPNSVTSIGERAFESCSSLTSVTIGNSVTSIVRYAFNRCSSLNSVTIPDSVTSIGDNAFRACSGLKSITIPNSVTSIEVNAFYGCDGLVEVYYSGTKQEWQQNVSIGSGNNALTNATIHFLDKEPPTCTVGSTNQISTSQTVTLSLSDNVGVAGYYWGTNSSYSSNTYTSVSGSPTTKSITKTVSDSGTYYLTAKDTSGNVSSTQSITFYKTTLNANNGSVSPSYVITKSGSTFTLPTPTRSGYTFDGWYTEASGGSKITSSSTITASQTIYAHWTDHTHNYTSQVTKAATCAASGVRTYTCSVCGDSYTETIAVTNNHSYSSRITRSATCGANGVRTYTCSVCGSSYTETIAPTGNHSWDKGRVTVAPTCYSFGEIIYTCTVCHETEWQLMDMLAHHFVKTTKKATLKANGAVIQKCSVCGEENGKTVIYYPKTIALSGTKYTYTGKAITPKVSVKGSNGKVIDSKNYTVTYAKGRKAVGRYAVKITFKGNYSGAVTKYFDIVPKGTAFSNAKSPKAKTIAIKWKKQSGISGYQVQLATNTAFTKGVKTYNAKASSLNAKISKGIRAKTNYYLRIRTFKTVKYGGKNLVLYSGWSKAVKVKTK